MIDADPTEVVVSNVSQPAEGMA
ncbi:MAG: hypothetical protein JWM61_2364, partial [Micrococcaceae bacterium]|nr:hypothetical protein [Micrococcaceae bacterium]